MSSACSPGQPRRYSRCTTSMWKRCFEVRPPARARTDLAGAPSLAGRTCCPAGAVAAAVALAVLLPVRQEEPERRLELSTGQGRCPPRRLPRRECPVAPALEEWRETNVKWVTLSMVLVLAACGGGSKDVPADAVAVVDGEEIARSDYDALVAQVKKSYKNQKRSSRSRAHRSTRPCETSSSSISSSGSSTSRRRPTSTSR